MATCSICTTNNDPAFNKPTARAKEEEDAVAVSCKRAGASKSVIARVDVSTVAGGSMEASWFIGGSTLDVLAVSSERASSKRSSDEDDEDA